MKQIETELPGVFLLEGVRHADSRGYFERNFCVQALAEMGLSSEFVQHNTSYSVSAGTVRGMHYQLPPHDEVKIVRVTAGAILDVVVDVRPTSTHFGRFAAFELSARDGRSLYIPSGFAHGLQTLKDETEVFYLMSRAFQPASARGISFRDPEIGIRWPLPVRNVSEKDESSPTLKAATAELKEFFR